MGGDARVPKLTQHVEFARRPVEPNHAGGKADLIVIGGMRKPHRLLVERRKTDRLNVSVAGERQGMAIIGQCKLAAFDGGGGWLDGGRIEMAEIHENRTVMLFRKVGIGRYVL